MILEVVREIWDIGSEQTRTEDSNGFSLEILAQYITIDLSQNQRN